MWILLKKLKNRGIVETPYIVNTKVIFNKLQSMDYRIEKDTLGDVKPKLPGELKQKDLKILKW